MGGVKRRPVRVDSRGRIYGVHTRERVRAHRVEADHVGSAIVRARVHGGATEQRAGQGPSPRSLAPEPRICPPVGQQPRTPAGHRTGARTIAGASRPPALAVSRRSRAAAAGSPRQGPARSRARSAPLGAPASAGASRRAGTPGATAPSGQRAGSKRVTVRRNDAWRYSRLMTPAISSAVANRS